MENQCFSVRQVDPERVHPDVWKYGHVLASCDYSADIRPFESRDALCNALLKQTTDLLFDQKTQLDAHYILFLGDYERAVRLFHDIVVAACEVETWKIYPPGLCLMYQTVSRTDCDTDNE